MEMSRAHAYPKKAVAYFGTLVFTVRYSQRNRLRIVRIYYGSPWIYRKTIFVHCRYVLTCLEFVRILGGQKTVYDVESF